MRSDVKSSRTVSAKITDSGAVALRDARLNGTLTSRSKAAADRDRTNRPTIPAASPPTPLLAAPSAALALSGRDFLDE